MRRAAGTPGATFLLIGTDQMVLLNEVVAILDQRACEAAPTREHIASCRRRGSAHDLTAGQPAKSAILCTRRLFLSPLTSATLRRRIAGGGTTPH
jgi:regulator of extracellular matrix RemA (YlzA/DUF370 family)